MWPAGSWRGCGSHAPRRRGCGCLRGLGPAQGGGGVLGPAERWDAARQPIPGATFRVSRQTLRRGGGAGQRRLHAPHGRPASRPLSRPAGAGVPGSRALLATQPPSQLPARSLAWAWRPPGRRPLRPPSPRRRRGPRKGGGRRPRPARFSPGLSLAHGHRFPASPGRPRGGRFHRPVRAGRGRGGRELGGIAPGGAEASRSWVRVRSLAAAAAQSWPSEDPGSPLAPGVFHNPALCWRLHLTPVYKVLQFWKPGCTRGFKRAGGLWH